MYTMRERKLAHVMKCGMIPIMKRFRLSRSRRELFSFNDAHTWKRYLKKRNVAPPSSLRKYLTKLLSDGQIVAAREIQGVCPDSKCVECCRHVFSGGLGSYIRDTDLSRFFASLFKEIANEFDSIRIHPTDLYHCHVVLYPCNDLNTEFDIALLFHAKEFPREYTNTGRKIHPIGSDEMGGKKDPRIDTECSIEDMDYHLRNFVYTMKTNRICLLDPKDPSFPRDILATGPSGDVFFSVNQFTLGVYLGDVNYFPHLHSKVSQCVFLSLVHSKLHQAYSADRVLFAMATCESILGEESSDEDEMSHLRDSMKHMTQPELRCVMSWLKDTEGELYVLFRRKLNQVTEATNNKTRVQFNTELKKLRDEQSPFLDEIGEREMDLFERALRETSFVNRGVESFSSFRASNLLAVMSKRFRGPMTKQVKIRGAFKRTCPHVTRTKICSEFKHLDVNPRCSSCDGSKCSGEEEEDFEWCPKYVCMTCNTYCCGRYIKGHMMKHAKETSHALAMNLGDASVWCYQCMESVDTFHPHFDSFRLKYAEAKNLTKSLIPLWVWNTKDVEDMSMALTLLSSVSEHCTRPDLALKALHLVQIGKSKDLNEAVCDVIDLSKEKSKIFFRQKTLAFTKTLLAPRRMPPPEKAKM